MKIFVICLIAWFIAQLIKVIINLAKYLIAKSKGEKRKKVTIETLFKLGGMPSSHTATVISLSASIGMHSGWNSDIFAVAGVFAFITMFDAIKVRLPMGRLTDAFLVVREMVLGKGQKKLKKVEGHTLPEVIGGFFVGAGVALIILKFTPLFPEYVSIFETMSIFK